MKIAVIGGGAAGFFAAITVKEHYPEAEVSIFEKSHRLLRKVRISGGGRCNVTNATASIKELLTAYPRGGKVLKKAFRRFSTGDAMHWFEKRGVPLVVQEDNCVFPRSQDSRSIIDCFLREAARLSIKSYTGHGVNAIRTKKNQLELVFSDKNTPPQRFHKVIIATGGSPQRKGLDWLEDLGHDIIEPAPSLFTFNIPDKKLTQLMGVVVEDTAVTVQSTKLKATGALLITHWGMSGPVILKLSSYGARFLHEKKYRFTIQVNWVNVRDHDKVTSSLMSLVDRHPKKILANRRPFQLPERLWLYLLAKTGLSPQKKWNELGKKGINRLVTVLTNDNYLVTGKSTHKEEFVTSGGVSLNSIDANTMESKFIKNLYFAGEVLDIDGITGGFNFQAAWTTGFIAGLLGNEEKQ